MPDMQPSEMRERIIQAAAFNTKHISSYDPGMKNLIINVDMLVEQIEELFSTRQRRAVIEGKIEELKQTIADTLEPERIGGHFIHAEVKEFAKQQKEYLRDRIAQLEKELGDG